MSNYQNISSFIWNVADDVLRGLFKPHEYGQIILPFTVLRRLDTILEPSKDEVIKLYKKWKSKTDKPTPITTNEFCATTGFCRNANRRSSRIVFTSKQALGPTSG